jgi:sialic acid synthase SpsE/D-lyxose ketol-isomerase
MQKKFSDLVRPMLVLDLANNHNGSLEHGRRILDETADAVKDFDFDFFVKFQYRQLDSFIHKRYKGDWSYKYVKRFEETRLTDDDYQSLIIYARSLGFGVACTPFDQESVPKVRDHGFDFLKIASVSLTDWPLLEEVAKANMPTVASTAGSSIKEIDSAASFLRKRVPELALMHCVAAYPTKDSNLELNRIDLLRNRYKGLTIGYSTHEDPNNLVAASLAIAKGAMILERHIGLGDDDQKLNSYSSDPGTLRNWLAALARSTAMLGSTTGEHPPLREEIEALQGLRRGIYAKNYVSAGKPINSSEVEFAVPLHDDQLSANEWSRSKSFIAIKDILPGDPLVRESVEVTNDYASIEEIASSAKQLFTSANVILPSFGNLEISHHYGLANFYQHGLVLITVINREYCKKIIGIFGGQTNPEHFHKLKEETFICVWGSASIEVNSLVTELYPGDILTVPVGAKHSITSKSGGVLEEISTNHNVSDSYYTDPGIVDSSKRKTTLSIWDL